MSSKVYVGGKNPAGKPVDAPGIVWRASGSAPLAQLARVDAASGIEVDPTAIYQKGLMAGKAEADSVAGERANAKLAPILASLTSVLKELAETRSRYRMQAEDGTVRLALAIAQRILHREMAVDPDAIAGLVRSGFDRLNAREVHRLRASPQDVAILEQNRNRLELPSALEITADSSLRPGSAIFETSRGELDASVTTQLDEIERGFTDLVKRRTQNAR